MSLELSIKAQAITAAATVETLVALSKAIPLPFAFALVSVFARLWTIALVISRNR